MGCFKRRAAFSILVVVAVTGWCAAKEKQAVTVTYVVTPPQPLPFGLKAVAVIDAGVETRGNKEDQREQKWSAMAADMIESMVASSSQRFGGGLKVAQRRLTKQILREQDLRLAGLVQGDDATRAGKLLDVQGLVTSRITINLDVQKGTKTTLDWAGILGSVTRGFNGRQPVVAPPPRVYQRQSTRERYVPDPRYARDPRYAHDPRYVRERRYLYDPRYAPPAPVSPAPPPGVAYPAPAGPVQGGGMGLGFGTKEVEEVSRHLTVQCSFSLVDAVSGNTIVQYSPPPYQKQDTASPNFMFGGIVNQAELDPVDHFIGELVERATQEFVSLIVPVEVEYTYELVGRHSQGEAGIRSLRAEDYDIARRHFAAGLAKYPDDDQTAFALGVTCELLGEPEQALSYYKQAAGMEDADKADVARCVAARKRLTDHLPRIMRTAPGVPKGDASPSGAPVSGPAAPTAR